MVYDAFPESEVGINLILAVRANDIELVRSILDSEPECINYQDKFGRTAAMYAAMKGRSKIIEYLFTHEQFDPHVTDKFDNDVFHYTFWTGDLDFARKVYQLMYPLGDEKSPSD